MRPRERPRRDGGPHGLGRLPDRLREHGRERRGLLLPAQEQPVAQRLAVHDEARHGEDRLGRLVLDAVEPLAGQRPERGDDGRARRPVADALDERRQPGVAGAEDEVLLGGEVVEDRLLGDVGRVRDLLDGHRVEPALAEQAHRRARDRLARATLLALTKPLCRGGCHRGVLYVHRV